MEIEKKQGKKFWNIVRIMFHIMRKNICKRKITVDEAIHMLHHHYSALSCRRDDFVSPRAYEFSCSNTPIYKNHNYQFQEVEAMRRVFEVLEASPLPESGGVAGQHQVDKDAEEFINNFYKDLKKQRRIAALGSPSPYHQFMG